MAEQNEQHVLVLVNVTAVALDPDTNKIPTMGVESALVNAVREALEHAEGRGFNHELSDTLGISVRYVGQHTPPDKPRTLYDIVESAKSDLQERVDDQDSFTDRISYLDGNDVGDDISEIADSAVPTYTSDIMEVAADDITMATTEPDIGPAFDGSPTPNNIIAANIYEAVTQALYEEATRLKDDLESSKEMCDECTEDFHEDDLTQCSHGMDLCKDCTTEVCKLETDGHTDEDDEEDDQEAGAEEARRQSRPDDRT